LLSMPWTRHPAAAKKQTTSDPIKPLEPVTKIDFGIAVAFHCHHRASLKRAHLTMSSASGSQHPFYNVAGICGTDSTQAALYGFISRQPAAEKTKRPRIRSTR